MKAAVLGSPVAHSLSPVLHRAAYAELGLVGWSYQAVECDEERLPGLLAGCGPEWAGLSLTMPLKRAVLPLLDSAGPLVAQVGAANTVVFSAGRKLGHNTDVPGMVTALTEAGSRVGTVLILGGGATACSALAAVAGLGATAATAVVRDPARAGGLLAAAGRLGAAVRLTDFAGPVPSTPDVLISTVPARAADEYAQRIEAGDLRPGLVFDVVYHPWPTSLADAARRAGLPVVGGFELLLHQAAGQVALMTGKPAPVAAMRTAGLAALPA
jgi:shikimate 5-dehydrogenase